MYIVNKACIIACLFLFSIQSFSKIIRDDHYTTGSNKYTWAQVCSKLVKHDSPLIKEAGVSQLNCMGTKVKVKKFCDLVEQANPYYTRAKVDKVSKSVLCMSAKRVVLKWQCEGKEDKYCKDEEVGCFLFKEKLAARLKLAYSSITDNKYLNCYFDTQQNSLELNL